jgi:DNA-binding GntR family transcriptional regulator
MTDFQNLELINKAIDNYALFNKTQKNVLKALIQVNIDGYSIISIKELCQMVKVTNTPVKNAILKLEQCGIIEDIQRRGIVFTGCKVKQSKISEIINRYNLKK